MAPLQIPPYFQAGGWVVPTWCGIVGVGADVHNFMVEVVEQPGTVTSPSFW
jgi:hypothetical protein